MAVLHSDLVSTLTLSGGLAILASALVLYTTIRAIYNVFFHPLSKVPGPKLYSITQFPYLWYITRGEWMYRLSDLHDQYGPVVRYAPDDVSFITADAYKNIYGHKASRARIFEKDLRAYRQNRPAPNLISANHEDHKRQRKLLSHAFSQKALLGQEGLINHYVDLFIQRLTEKARQGEAVNMVGWYNFATFDLIGHLALGQPFGCLETGNYHPWVRRIFNTMKSVPISQALVRLGFKNWIPYLTPKTLQKSVDEHWKFTEHAAGARLDAKDTNSQDFMSYILRHNDERGMSRPEILENSSLLIIAGSETTATLLSGATYFLLKNPDKYDKLVKEVRSTFTSEDEITATRVDHLKYLLAVLSETFRFYPPVAVGLPRITPAGGEFLEGYHIPEKTSVSVPQLPAYQSSRNFRDPKKFLPERWLGDPLYANDSRAVLQPFSMGPRDCIGKNLAYVEMRILLTRLLWKFDLELMPESNDWYKQKIYITWEKDELMVKLTEVVREK